MIVLWLTSLRARRCRYWSAVLTDSDDRAALKARTLALQALTQAAHDAAVADGRAFRAGFLAKVLAIIGTALTNLEDV